MKDPNTVPYFHGKVTREQAEEMLQRSGCVEGSFLLRQSADNNYAVSICHNGKVLHYNVERQFEDGSFQIPKGRRFPGPVELVEHHAAHLDGFLTLAQHALVRPQGEAPLIYQPSLTGHDLEEALIQCASQMGFQGPALEAVLRSPVDRQRLQVEALRDLHLRQAWYHDALYREEAEKRLAKSGHLDGRFLVRYKHENESYVLTVSVQGQAKHYKIETHDDGKLSIEGGKVFDSLIEMIDHYHIRQEGLLCKLKSAVECPGYKRPSRRATLPSASISNGHSRHLLTPTLTMPASTSSHSSSSSFLSALHQPSGGVSSEPETPPLIQLDDWPAVESLRISSTPLALNQDQPTSSSSLSFLSTLQTVAGASASASGAQLDSSCAADLAFLTQTASSLCSTSTSTLWSTNRTLQPHNRTASLPQVQSSSLGKLQQASTFNHHFVDPCINGGSSIGGFIALNAPQPQPWSIGLPPQSGLLPLQQSQFKPFELTQQRPSNLVQQTIVRPSVAPVLSNASIVGAAGGSIFSTGSCQLFASTTPIKPIPANQEPLPAAVADMNAAVAAATASAFAPLSAAGSTPFSTSRTFTNNPTKVSLNMLSQTQHIMDIAPESLMTSCIVEAPWEDPDQSEDSGSQNSGQSGVGLSAGGAFGGENLFAGGSGSSDDAQRIYDSLPHNEGTFNIRVEQLRLKERLGGGNFGHVLKAAYRCDDGREIPVAVKTLKEGGGEHAQKEILMEARTMFRLRHCNIVRLLGVCKADTVMLVLELAPLGPIHKYLKKHPETSIPCLTELIYQVCQAMAYLELQKFVHRDLAARNVLLVNKHYAKISDFGMSKALGFDNDYYKAETAGKWPLKWYAPECIYKFKFDSKSDVWSFGVTLWEVYSFGDRPYRDLRGMDIIQMLERGERLGQPMWCPDPIYQVMRRCWEYESERRPSFSELVRHLYQMPRQMQT